MSAKILASMNKNDASLTLIADNFMGAEALSKESLEAALANVNVAKGNASKALAFLSKSATQGRKGIASMATDSFDSTMGMVQQVSAKANLLSVAIQAELDELEENMVTEDIQEMDYEEDGETAAVAAEATSTDAASTEAGESTLDVDHNGIGEKLEEETISPTDQTASTEATTEATESTATETEATENIEALDVDHEGSGELLETEEIKPTDQTASTEATTEASTAVDDSIVDEEDNLDTETGELGLGEEVIESEDDVSMDLMGMDEGTDLFEEEVSEEDEGETAASDKAALRASASRQTQAANGSLESVWKFSI